MPRIITALNDGAPPHLLLLFDFDGTLCEFAPTPEASRLSPSRRGLLEQVAARPGITVGVVSGRRLADVRDRVGLGAPLCFAGLHGMEIEAGGERFFHDGVRAVQGHVQQIRLHLVDATANLTGIVVEDKEFSFVLHTRLAGPPVKAEALHLLGHLAETHKRAGAVRLQYGDEMCEVLPNVAWNKGDAVLWIERAVSAHRHGRLRPMYLGDDLTDEHAFHALGARGITVVVGARPSSARFRLSGPPEVEALLRMLAAMPGSHWP